MLVDQDDRSARQRVADRPGPRFPLIGIDRDDAGTFGHPIAFEQPCARRRLEPQLQCRKHCRAARKCVEHGRVIGLRAGRMLDHRLKHGRDPAQIGAAAARDCGKRLTGLELGQEDDLAAAQYGPVENRGVGEDVEQRQRAKYACFPALARLARLNRLELERVDRKIGVGQRRTLGDPGGPAGILNDCNVSGGIDSDGLRVGAVGQQVGPKHHAPVCWQRHSFLSFEQAEANGLERREHLSERADDQVTKSPGLE